MQTHLTVAIDPGTTQSAIVFWDGEAVRKAEILDNHACLDTLRKTLIPISVAVEMVACYGMAVGKEVFETCLLIGRIQELCAARGIQCRLVYRLQVKLHHCHDSRAKDPNIRQALIDKYGPPGTKNAKGRTYGLASHLWAAFAIATFVSETAVASIEIKEAV